MYKWIVTFKTRQGRTYVGYHEGPEDNSGDVLKTLIDGQPDNCYTTIYTSDKKDGIMTVRIGEIEAIYIKEAK